MQAGHPHHQHRARRAHRRGRAQARDRERRRGRRRSRRVREGTAGRLGARATAPGGRDAAHCGVDRGSAGTGGARHGGRRPRLPPGRRRPERGQLSVDASGRTPAASAVDSPGRCAGVHRHADGTGAARDASALRYYGALAESRAADIAGRRAPPPASCARFCPAAFPIVNARAAARERGIEIIESRSTRPRHFTSLVSFKLHTSDGERWVEGTVFEPNSPRLVSVQGVKVEAPLAGTMLIIANDDQPGVIGEVGTILGTARRQHRELCARARGHRSGRRGQRGRSRKRAVGAGGRRSSAIRQVPAVRQAWVVRLPLGDGLELEDSFELF